MKLKELFENETVYKADIQRTDYQLTTLDGILPNGCSEVEGYYNVSKNLLTSLKGAPTQVGEYFSCEQNKIASLEFCPTEVNGYFDCASNKLTSLQGIHKQFKGGYIKGGIYIGGNPIKSHLLGLLLIPELTIIFARKTDEYYDAIEIINKHLKGDRDVIECQQELIEAGFKQYAQL